MFEQLFISFLIIPVAWVIAYALNKKQKKTATKQKTTVQKGQIAEDKVANILSHFEADDCKVINGCLFEFDDGNTTQIDHILINQQGVYVIETKNYSGEVYKLNDTQWCHRNGTKENIFYSPVKQNENHIKSIMSKIGVYDKQYFHSIVAFSESTYLPLVMKETVPVIHINDLGKELLKEKDVCISKASVERIYNAIVKENKNSKAYMKKHIKNIQKRYSY